MSIVKFEPNKSANGNGGCQLDKYLFEVQITLKKGKEKKTVVAFGSNKQKAIEDVFYQLCEESKIPQKNVEILRLISVG